MNRVLYVCSECKTVYKRNFELRRHVIKLHTKKLDLIAPSQSHGNLSFKCNLCDKQYSHERNLNFHIKTTHNEVVVVNKATTKSKCALCQFVTTFKKDYIKHYEQSHSIKMEFEEQEFNNYDDLADWKNTVEKQTCAKYVKEKRTKSSTTSYICHRSGYLNSKSQGKRHRKAEGSNKINGFCPSMMKVYENDNKFQVYFIRTHVGHVMEPNRVSLTKSHRQKISTKIQANIPFEAVLDEMRKQGSSLDSIRLLTKKDLYNIKACFNLQPPTVTRDDASIDSWVSEMTCVLLYKPQDTLLQKYPQLKEDDFLLIIMNDGQKEILRKFAGDCVCIDNTHEIHSNQFELHTLLVLDDLRQGFPCAFCISSRTDETIMTVFLTCVKEAAGIVNTKVFMSDKEQFYYTAWCKVMTEAKLRLYCTWDVDRDWRENLTLINSKGKQDVIYKTLRTLLEETDSSTFEDKLKQFLETVIDDSDTAGFAFYFADNYVDSSQSWAHCYRINSWLNIGRTHRAIKYVIIHGKNAKRLDKTINALMKFIRDKLFDRLIMFNKRKLRSKMAEIRQRHISSLGFNMSLVVQEGNRWKISSSDGAEPHTIYENDTDCPCELICIDCDVCIHRYYCSCFDSEMTWNMCEHIHLLCRFRSEEPTSDIQESEESDWVMESDNDNKSEISFEEMIDPLKVPENQDLTVKKEEMLRRFSTIVDAINTDEEWNALEKIMEPLNPTLEAIRQQNSLSCFESIEKKPAIEKLTRRKPPKRR